MALTKKQLEECEAKHAKKKVAKKPTKAEKEAVAKKAVAKKAVAKKKVAKKPTKAQKEAEKAKKAKKAPVVDKDLLQNVLGVMAEVAKEKGKSTQKGIDSKVAFEKRIRDGKLTLKEFSQEMFNDDDTSAEIYNSEEDAQEVHSYNMGYWLSRVSKRADSWEELTEKQQERLGAIMDKDVQKGIKAKMKAFWTKFIKGKKLKNMKAVNELFIKEYYGVEYGI